MMQRTFCKSVQTATRMSTAACLAARSAAIGLRIRLRPKPSAARPCERNGKTQSIEANTSQRSSVGLKRSINQRKQEKFVQPGHRNAGQRRPSVLVRSAVNTFGHRVGQTPIPTSPAFKDGVLNSRGALFAGPRNVNTVGADFASPVTTGCTRQVSTQSRPSGALRCSRPRKLKLLSSLLRFALHSSGRVTWRYRKRIESVYF